MTKKNFNAKKMLMSTLAAVAFSFVFTTDAYAGKCLHIAGRRTLTGTEASLNTQQQQVKEEKTDIFTTFLNFIMGKC